MYQYYEVPSSYQDAHVLVHAHSSQRLSLAGHSPRVVSTADPEILSNRKRANHRASRTIAPLLHSGYSLATTPAGPSQLENTQAGQRLSRSEAISDDDARLSGLANGRSCLLECFPTIHR
jgi:hypothetical protein